LRTVRFAVREDATGFRKTRSADRGAATAMRMVRKALDDRASGCVCFRQEIPMTREEYEERRSALEEQHRADVALLTAAHELRLRSLERLWREDAGGEPQGAPPAPFAVAAPPVATVRGAVPEAEPPVAQPKTVRYSVVNDLDEALDELPEVFDRHDILRALGYVPPRTTLLRALQMLMREGAIAAVGISSGGVKTRYRKLASSD
jgi:hypothetical protein